MISCSSQFLLGRINHEIGTRPEQLSSEDFKAELSPDAWIENSEIKTSWDKNSRAAGVADKREPEVQ